MKKVCLVAAVLLLAVPVWATVNITCTPGTDADCNLVTVAFQVVTSQAEPNKVSGFGLDITVDSGAKIKSISTLSADYWVYPGSIVILNGEVNDVGTPIGDPVRFPGTLGGLDTGGISIEMGALHDPPGDSYLPISGTLLKLRVDKDCNVVVAENAIRGGVVLTNPSIDPTVNLTGCKVACGGVQGCLPTNATYYAQWVLMGKPNCWCYARQCHGDAEGKYETDKAGNKFFVHFKDLNVVLAGWSVKEAPNGPGILSKNAPDGTACVCADFKHDEEKDKQGNVYRVHFNDLNILLSYWSKKEPPAGTGIPPDCGGTLTPP